MLILTIKPRQCVNIDGDIHLKVLSVSGKKIIMGFDAPDHISIARDNCKNTTKKHREQAKDGTFSKEGVI